MRRAFGDNSVSSFGTKRVPHLSRFGITGTRITNKEKTTKALPDSGNGGQSGIGFPEKTKQESNGLKGLNGAEPFSKRVQVQVKKSENFQIKKMLGSTGNQAKITTVSSFNMPRIQPSFTAPRYFQIPSLAFFMPSKMDCILTPVEGKGGIYLGNIEGAKDVRSLVRNGINAVLTVAADSGIKYSPRDIPLHKVINADDIPSYSLIKHFDECIEFMDKALATGNVFVHCFAGMSRSSTIVIAYLLKRKNFRSLQSALEFVKSKRMIVQPNIGFMRQLRLFEDKLLH